MSVAKMVGAINDALTNDSFSQLALNHYQGTEPALKKIIIRKIIIKREELLSFTYRYQTKDIVKNYPVETALQMVAEFLYTEWNHAILYTIENDLIFQRQVTPKGKVIHLNKAPPSTQEKPAATHDKQKNRLIKAENASYLTELKLADSNGKIYQNAQDKFRQINKFIEIFASLLQETSLSDLKTIVDMGSGKGYLTFALYDYLTRELKQDVTVTGVEFRPDMVALCNDVAVKVGFEKLHFVEGSIKDYKPDSMNALIALHACDTATDEAIAGGINAGSEIILCAPCCHKQIRREMEQCKVDNDLAFLTQYGTFMEREAEMVTDGLRALILNYYSYKTKVFEFISDAHTPKNVMITAVKSTISDERRKAILEEIKKAKNYFGIRQHHLEKLLDMPS